MPRVSRPSADFCFGRTAIAENLRSSLNDTAAALLFGGRLSGKTTLLLYLERELGSRGASAAQFASIDVPVYIDLMTMPPDAGPSDFFRLLSRRLGDACASRIDGFIQPKLPTETALGAVTLDAFLKTCAQ